MPMQRNILLLSIIFLFTLQIPLIGQVVLDIPSSTSLDIAQNHIIANITQGGYFGILLFIILIFFTIGLWTNNKLFIVYSFYVAATSLLIFNDPFYSFTSVSPNTPVFTGYSRIFIVPIFMVATRIFIIEYFDLQKILNNSVKRAFLGSVIFPFVLLISWIFLRNFINDSTFTTLYVANVFVFVLIVVGLLIFLIRKQRRRVLSFLLALCGFTIGILVDAGVRHGYLEGQHFIMSPLQLGSLFELMVLNALIVLGIKDINDRQSDLMANVARSQDTLALSLVNTQETERTNIAREIHDVIGGNLALLKQRAVKSGIDGVDLIDNTLSSIRAISHNLYTPIFSSNNLQIKLTALANDYTSEDMEYHVLFHNWPAIEKEDIKVHIYRIAQELFQNSHKNRAATQIFLQFLRSDDEHLQVMYEDDGKEINQDSENTLDLKNIQYRVESMNGHMDIEQYNNGVSINIAIPISILHN